jgi:hypothetical protein
LEDAATTYMKIAAAAISYLTEESNKRRNEKPIVQVSFGRCTDSDAKLNNKTESDL